MQQLFGDLGVQIVPGHRFLGGYLGDHSGRMQYVSEKVNVWVSHLLSLTKIADEEPQAAYTALTKSFQHEWTFLQRVVCGCDSSFLDLESTIFSQFFPVLLGCEVSSSDRKLFSLSTKFGGLGIIDPVTSAARSHNVSVHAITILTKTIKNGSILDLDSHVNVVLSAHHHDVIFLGM